MRVLLQGDTHGNTNAIVHALALAQNQSAELVIQLGDFGYGWRLKDSRCSFTDRVSRYAQNYNIDVWWIDGNHENFDYLEATGAFGAAEPVEMAPRVWYIPRGTVLPVGDSRVLFVGGAYSVDKPYRTPHVSWWSQEELTAGDVERALSATDVDVIVSHDVCDTGFRAALSLAVDDVDTAQDGGGQIRLTDRGRRELEHLVWKNDQTFPEAKRNRMALEAIYQHHRPPLAFNGHYHSAFEVAVDGTSFVGLAHELNHGAMRFVEL